jgi:hypothetical protein
MFPAFTKESTEIAQAAAPPTSRRVLHLRATLGCTYVHLRATPKSQLKLQRSSCNKLQVLQLVAVWAISVDI